MMRSLFSGVSGLKNHQTRMDVIGNNIANVNTAGFKGSRVTFQDMLNQSMSAASSPQGGRGGTNPQQVGLGMGLSSIDTYFGNGNVQTTGKNTDLCISDNGFFIVADGDTKYYTRAGGFDFDTQGNYIIPGSGLHVQGWMADGLGQINTSGQPTDIKVPSGQTMPAKASDAVTFGKNLSAEGKYATTTIKEEALDTVNAKPNVGDPFAARPGFTVKTVNESAWTGTKTMTTQEVTTPGAIGSAGPSGSTLKTSKEIAWKMMGKLVPADSGFGSDADANAAGYIIGQAVPAGNCPGYIVSDIKSDGTVHITKEVTTKPNSSDGLDGGFQDEMPVAGAPASKWNVVWEKTITATGVGNKPDTTKTDADGFKVDTLTTTAWDVNSEKITSRKTNPDGSDIPGEIITGGVKTTTTLTPAYVKTSEITAYDSLGKEYKITVNFTKEDDNKWKVTAANANTSPAPGFPIAGLNYEINFNSDGTFLSVDNDNPVTFNPTGADPVSIKIDFKGLTQYSGETTATVTDYTGYTAGSLQSVSIDKTGTIIGKFTNNLTRSLGQVALATFNNPGGLTKTGNSLYSESNNSGIAQVSTANNGGAGSITPNSLEMSNVDLSDEFSNMIITQRGFQSNSKIITVSDEMLDTLIGMKR